jgi:hypothetical protein
MKLFVKQVNINKLFLHLRIFHGYWDGEKVVRKTHHYVASRLSALFVLFFMVKQSSIMFVRQESIWAFFVGDFANFENRMIQLSVSMLCFCYFSWNFAGFTLYQRLNFSKKDNFWLRFIPFDLNRELTSEYFVHPVGQHFFRYYVAKTKSDPILATVMRDESDSNRNSFASEHEIIPGLTGKQFHRLQLRYHKYTRLAVYVLLLLGLAMSIVLNLTYYIGFAARFKHKPYFWPVFTFNTIGLSTIAFHTYFVTIGVSMNYTYLTYLQHVRFKNAYKKMFALIRQPDTDYVAVNREVRCFNLIVLDMLRINHFWSKVFGFNYFFAMLCLFLFSQQIINGEAMSMRIGFFILMCFIYFSCLVFPVMNANLVNHDVRLLSIA